MTENIGSRADRIAIKMFSAKPRWITTVGLELFLGAFFLAFPTTTMRTLDVPETVHMGILFQLYGALLLSRGVMEQLVRNRLDLWLIRAYMISTFPFGIGSGVLLAYASVRGLMNPWIGWIWAFMFAAEIVEFTVALTWHAAERRAI